ncbi:MAG: right-handed parallel beta-helix repeat-containing protein [Phycisphaerales bacterium]|nr:right-handed parallel beta-helix repeat-containing protein [Phycisphaerales bacterium]
MPPIRLAAALPAMLLLSTSIPAAILTVDQGGGGDYVDIQSAVYAAADGDTVHVMPGTYTATGTAVVWISDQIVTIEGVGDVASIIIDGEDARYGFHVDSSDQFGTTIRNMTITRGLDSGVRAYFSNPSIESCHITGCSGSAVVAVGDAVVAMQDCEVSYNTADNGPGLMNPGATITADGCEFHHNEATGGSPLSSSLYGGSMTLTNSAIHHNAGSDGGAVYSGWSTLVVDGCTLHHNQAGYMGAAIYAYGTGVAQISNCDVSWNFAAYDGGAVAARSGASLELTSSTIASNAGRGVVVAFGSDASIDTCNVTSNLTNTEWGGGIYLNGGTHTITNTTIAGNDASNGAAIGTNWNTSVSIDGCTIANNTCWNSFGYEAALFGSYTQGDGRSVSNSDFCGNLPNHIDDDFAAGDDGSNTIEPSCTWCSADIDGSLDVGLSDIFYLVDNWGPCASCPGDFNEDSNIGVADLLYLLQEWNYTIEDPV